MTPAECCWVLVGSPRTVVRRRRVVGRPDSVEADWAWALEREETSGDVQGFLHTHPPGSGVVASLRDVRTMRAWCSALGKPLLCIILEGEERACYRFADDAGSGRPVGRIELEPEIYGVTG